MVHILFVADHTMGPEPGLLLKWNIPDFRDVRTSSDI